MIDVIAGQRVLADLVLDDDVRRAWEQDPSAFAGARLGPAEAEMIAGLDPAGLAAMAASHQAKRARFDYLHALHHAYEDAKAEGRSHPGVALADQAHDHGGHDHGGHDHGAQDHGAHDHGAHDHRAHEHVGGPTPESAS